MWSRQHLLRLNFRIQRHSSTFHVAMGDVLRWLRAAWPDALIGGCDLNRAGVDWCAETMNALPIYSAERLTHVPLGGPYDLIWVGSLLTHMDQELWPECIGTVLASLLAPRALVTVIAHGQQTPRDMRICILYGLNPRAHC